MNTDPTPTVQEREMAATRAEMAREIDADVAECIRLLGPGADAYAYWVITDRKGLLPVQKIATCRRQGSVGWVPACPNPGERLTEAPEGQTAIDKDGTKHFPFRFVVSIQVFSSYKPQSAEQLAAARAKREDRMLDQLKDEFALFPELVPAEAAKIGTPSEVIS